MTPDLTVVWRALPVPATGYVRVNGGWRYLPSDEQDGHVIDVLVSDRPRGYLVDASRAPTVPHHRRRDSTATLRRRACQGRRPSFGLSLESRPGHVVVGVAGTLLDNEIWSVVAPDATPSAAPEAAQNRR